ncbi:MAG: tetratricopeptide repeat protein [Candidatus Latescibacteria bacterium]|nr:tetratricopeptide repeat protein [Candidatus Latescibacterota bacterium]
MRRLHHPILRRNRQGDFVLPRLLRPRSLICGALFLLTSTLGFSPVRPQPDSDLPAALRAAPFARDAREADSLVTRGVTAAALDRYRTLEQAIRRQSPVDPDGLGWVWSRLATALEQSGQPRAAAARLDTLIAAFPTTRWATAAHAERGRMLCEAGRYRDALPHLLQAAERAGGETAGRLAFRVASCYQRTEQWQHAVEWYDRAQTQYPILSDYALYDAARCLTKLGRSEDAINRSRLMIARHPHSPFITPVTLLVIDRLIASGRDDEALTEARALLNRDHQLTRMEVAEVLASIGHAHAGAERPDSALTVYRTVLAQYRDTPSALAVVTKFQGLKARRGERLTDEERLWCGLAHLENRSYQGAIREFQTLLQAAPSGPYAPDASYSIGRSHYLMRQYRVAEREFQRFLSRYPRHEKAGAASLHLARCARQIKGEKLAIHAYVAFIKGYPKDPAAPEALWYVGRFLDIQDRFKDAAEHYRRLWDDHPQHEYADEARWREGFCYYRLGRFTQAAETFQSLVDAHPASKIADRAVYWTARASHRDRRLDDARRVYGRVIQAYPASYYAYRARQNVAAIDRTPAPPELSGRPRTVPTLADPPALDVLSLIERFRRPDGTLVVQGTTDGRGLAEAVHLDRARALLDVGLIEEAEHELTFVQEANPSTPAALAEITALYYEYRLYRQGIRAAAFLRRMVESGSSPGQEPVPPLFLYPVPYWTLIQQEANAHGLDPLFLLSVMRQESRFDRWIASWAGARGLMQLMPATARQLAKQARMPEFSVDRLYEPEVSTRLGARFLQEQLSRFGGRPELALAAYNGGPGRVSRWLKKRDAGEIDEFVEGMDVGETREFVKVVMENYARYTSLLASDFR